MCEGGTEDSAGDAGGVSVPFVGGVGGVGGDYSGDRGPSRSRFELLFSLRRGCLLGWRGRGSSGRIAENDSREQFYRASPLQVLS